MTATESSFDTNILLYLLSSDAEKADRVEQLVALGGIVSVQVLNEVVSVALGKLNMDLAEVRDLLATIRAVCAVRPVDLDTHDRALDLVERYRFSVYDSLIVAAALQVGWTTLLTEDPAAWPADRSPDHRQSVV